MLITNYKIIKFKYKLNSNVNEKLLTVPIFKEKKYIILKILLLLLLLIPLQLKTIKQELQIIFKLKLKVIIN